MSSSRSIAGFRFPLQNYNEEKAINTNFRHLQDHLSRLSLESGQAPDIVVAPVDNAQPGKANVYLRGVADDVKIQESINELEAQGGGWLHFKAGTISTSAEVTVDTNVPIKITGSGWSTVWKPTATMALVLDVTNPSYFTLAHIKFDGNSQTQTTGVFRIQNSTRYYINDVWITGGSTTGFVLGTGFANIVDNYASSNGGHGFSIYNENYMRVIGNWAHNNTVDGFRATLNFGDPASWIGNTATNNTVNGFWIRQPGVLLVANVAEGNGTNYELTGVDSHAHNIDGGTHIAGNHDSLNVEDLGTASTDVSTNLKPDGAGGVEFVDSDHADLANVGTDDHHTEAHTVASHSDTTATGAELETLTDGSNGDALHVHAGGSAFSEFMVMGA